MGTGCTVYRSNAREVLPVTPNHVTTTLGVKHMACYSIPVVSKNSCSTVNLSDKFFQKVED